jgi:Mrp family chromosome partitioning ATPase
MMFPLSSIIRSSHGYRVSYVHTHTYTEQYTLQPDKTLASFMQKQSKPSTLNKVNAVIAIASGKGGVGKSTVAGKLSKYIHERRWYNVYL